MPLSDIQIAARAKMRPIADLAAERLGLGEDDIVLYGRHKAKLPAPTAAQKGGKQGNLVLVTAVTPTPAGEGKTTTSVGLCDALNRIGKKHHRRLARAVAGAGFRRQRRGRRRRARASRADGRHQFAFHRRFFGDRAFA